MNLDDFDPESVMRELERLAEGAARAAKAEVDRVFYSEGYHMKSEAEQEAFLYGARIGGTAMLNAISVIVPKIVGLDEGETPSDEGKGNGKNPFSL